MTASSQQVPLRPAPAGRGRRLLGPAVVVGATAAVLTVVRLVDPNEAGHYPTCPWLALTGTYCPGCGSLRATHALAEGDLVTAWQRNPLAVVGFAILAWIFVAWTRRQWSGRARTTMAPPWMLWTLLWGVLAFWVLRNVPGWTWLSPA